MQTVVKSYEEHLAVLRLDNGPTNPIGTKLIDDLSESLVEVKRNARGMVLLGKTEFFSVGFDLPELIRFDRPAMADFLEKFNRLCLELFTAPFPTVCALSGHAVAGGNILALTGDYRYASSEKKKIGLNELKLGLPVPYLADMVLRHTIGDRYASQMIYSGEFMLFSDAKIIGLIDAICPPEELEAFSLERLAQIAGFSQQAFSAAKANKVEKIKRRFEKRHKAKDEIFLDCWFSDPVQKVLQEASVKF